MAPITTVAIAGITGTLARLIVEKILALPEPHTNIEIHGLCRTPSKLLKTLREHPRITLFQATAYDSDAIRGALKGVDIAVCCYLGDDTVMTKGQRILIDACIEAGVPRYMAGDWSMDFRKLELGEHPPKDAMIRTWKYLEEREEKIKAVHILNACFLERPWPGIFDGKKEEFTYWGSGEERWEFTTYEDAAAFTAWLVADGRHSGWFTFRGDHRNAFEIAEDYEAAYERKPALRNIGSLLDLYRVMHKARDEQPGNVWAWLGMFYTYYSLNGQTTLPQPLDNEKFPDVKVTTVKEYFERTPLKKLGVRL